MKARFGCLKRAMDINILDLPNVIYACFVLHNYCELNESVNEETVRSALSYDQEFQPDTSANCYMTDCNETEGKRIRRILTTTLTLNNDYVPPLTLPFSTFLTSVSLSFS